MTAAQWEAWVEKAAIMEYEGGLDRKAATLAAFALHFPADYRAMKETATAHPGGEAALYEFLEGLIKTPGTAIGGAKTGKMYSCTRWTCKGRPYGLRKSYWKN